MPRVLTRIDHHGRFLSRIGDSDSVIAYRQWDKTVYVAYVVNVIIGIVVQYTIMAHLQFPASYNV